MNKSIILNVRHSTTAKELESVVSLFSSVLPEDEQTELILIVNSVTLSNFQLSEVEIPDNISVVCVEMVKTLHFNEPVIEAMKIAKGKHIHYLLNDLSFGTEFHNITEGRLSSYLHLEDTCDVHVVAAQLYQRPTKEQSIYQDVLRGYLHTEYGKLYAPMIGLPPVYPISFMINTEEVSIDQFDYRVDLFMQVLLEIRVDEVHVVGVAESDSLESKWSPTALSLQEKLTLLARYSPEELASWLIKPSTLGLTWNELTDAVDEHDNMIYFILLGLIILALVHGLVLSLLVVAGVMAGYVGLQLALGLMQSQAPRTLSYNRCRIHKIKK